MRTPEGRRLFVGTTTFQTPASGDLGHGAIAASGKPGAALALYRKIILAVRVAAGLFSAGADRAAVNGRNYSELHVTAARCEGLLARRCSRPIRPRSQAVGILVVG